MRIGTWVYYNEKQYLINADNLKAFVLGAEMMKGGR